jgi:hypothetical protein
MITNMIRVFAPVAVTGEVLPVVIDAVVVAPNKIDRSTAKVFPLLWRHQTLQRPRGSLRGSPKEK